MKTPLRGLGLIVALFLTFVAVTSACDSDGQLTVEEFFHNLEELYDQSETDSAPLEEELNQLTDESSPNVALGVLRQQTDIIEDLVDGITELNPPDEAADLVDEAVSAGREVVQVIRDAIDDAEGAESLEELEDFFAIFETEKALYRFDLVCLGAEQLAADNEITVDLDCGG